MTEEPVAPRRMTRMRRARARRRRLQRNNVVVVTGLVLVVGLLLPGGPPQARPVPVTFPSGAPDPATVEAQNAARRFLDHYVDPDGRVVRHDQGGDTVSEGQTYALLLSVALDDQERFDQVWDWTQRHLQRRDGLLSWHWRDGRVADAEPAADADVDAAHALVLAAARFDEPRYAQDAMRIATAVRELETAPTDGGHILVAGPWARGRVLTVNPGYLDPRAFAVLGTLTGDEQWWADLTAGSYHAVDALHVQGPLPPDWAVIDASGTRPIPAPGSSGGTPRYGLDAARLPVRFAGACDPAARDRAAALWTVWNDVEPADVPQFSTLTGRPVTVVRHALPLVAAAGAAQAAGRSDEAGRLLDAAGSRDVRTPSYYGAAWVALGRVLLTTDLLGACDG